MTSFSSQDIERLNSNSHDPVAYGHKVGKARLSFSAAGGKAIGTHGLGLVLPKGCILTSAYGKVLTTFTSATDAATLAINFESAGDIIPAADIDDVGNPWDEGDLSATVIVDLASVVENTQAREIGVTVAVEALTAGKLLLWVEYLYYGDESLT